jgi:NTP pyrophosphatase (non-canonical NTP hydrolase)
MTINLAEYLKFARSTSVYPKIMVLTNPTEDQLKRCDVAQIELSDITWIYPLIGLMGELGELSNIMKKVIRDDNYNITEQRREKIIDEKGDISWYDIILDYELKIDPDSKIGLNIHKLTKRKEEKSLHDNQNRNETIKPISLFMDTLKELEGKEKKAVPRFKLINQLILAGHFNRELAESYIRVLLRNASIYESRPRCYNTV